MNIRKIGLWLCPLAFLAMLVALYFGNFGILIVEAALMITGAVLSLHPKPQRAITFHVGASDNPPSSADIARHIKDHHLY